MTWYRASDWPIKTKVFVYTCLVMMLSVCSVTSLILYQSYQAIWNDFEVHADALTSFAAKDLELPVMIAQQSDINRIINSVFSIESAHIQQIRVLDPKASQIAFISRDKTSPDILVTKQQLWSDLIEDALADPIEIGDNNRREYLGYVEISYDLTPIMKNIEAILVQTLILAALVIALACAAGYLFANAITRPLSRLQKAAYGVAKGDLSRHITWTSEDELGEVVRAFNNMVDSLNRATEALKKINRKLKQSNEDLDRFAYVVSHDLGAPLRRIDDFTRILSRTLDEKIDDKERKLIERIRRASESGQEMMNGLLQLSRVSTRAKPFEKTDLTLIAHKIAEDCEFTLKQLNGQIHIDTLPSIDADPLQITQLFQNLIGNSLKYRRDDIPPEIWISSETIGTNVTLLIRDNGIGFEPEQAEMIFQVFQRLHKDQSRYEGSGVGLAICERIVRRMHGSISARSQPGVGSTFSITLPRVQVSLEDVTHD